ncbi:unnamed protein product, partial [Medioppia subpectinata]
MIIIPLGKIPKTFGAKPDFERSSRKNSSSRAILTTTALRSQSVKSLMYFKKIGRLLTIVSTSSIEKVLSLQEEELKFLDNVRNCINIRIRCDRDYASSLLMVAVCGQKCHFNDNIGNTNIGTVWRTIADETHELSKLMANSADELTHEVLELIDELVSEKKALR